MTYEESRSTSYPLDENFASYPPSPLEFPGTLTPPPLWNFQFPPWWGYGYFLELHNEESATEESQPSALQWSSTLQQINVKQFSIHHGPTRDLRKKMQLPKTSSMYLSTMLTLMKLSNKQLHKLIRKGNKCSQQPKQKFQPISG